MKEPLHASTLTSDKTQGGAFLLKGTDPYWLSYAEKIFRSLLSEDSLSLRILDKVSGVPEILSAFDTICFTNEKTVVLVKDDTFVPTEKEHALLLSFLCTELSPNYLVFCNSPFLSPAETKLCQTIDCSPPDKFSCLVFAEKFFPFGIEKNAVRLLGELCGYDMAKMECEAMKLNAYCDQTLVSVEDVETLIVEDTETTVFLFSNSIVEGQPAKAQRQLDKLIKRGEKPAMLLSVLSNQFRRMLYCAVTPLDNKEMAALLGIKEFAVEKTRKIKGYSQAKLKSCVSMLTDCEYNFKSGLVSDEVAFSTAVSKLLAKEVI